MLREHHFTPEILDPYQQGHPVPSLQLKGHVHVKVMCITSSLPVLEEVKVDGISDNLSKRHTTLVLPSFPMVSVGAKEGQIVRLPTIYHRRSEIVLLSDSSQEPEPP